MKIIIKGKEVTIEDDSGGISVMTTDQLLEMLRVLNAAINAGGDFYFDILKFTV